MRLLRHLALAAALAAPAAQPAAADPLRGVQDRFLTACMDGDADHSVCICILDRLMATIEEQETLAGALAAGVSNLPSHSDPRVPDAFASAVKACGGRLVVRNRSEG